MESIKINAELLLVINSKNEWISKIPRHLPKKKYPKENFLWIDANGNSAEKGEDFESAELIDSYPIKIYRLQTITQSLPF